MKQSMNIVSNSLELVADFIGGQKVKSLLLITGHHFDTGKLSSINNQNIDNVDHYVVENELPNLDSVAKRVKKSSSRPELVVAIGGGRILDAAKLALHVLMPGSLPYFIAIPTTAGSGSEATPFAVAFKNKKKYSIENSAMLAHWVLLDASLLESLPSKQRAISGIDALAQSIESIWSKNANEVSIDKSQQALQLIIPGLVDFVTQIDFKRDQQMLQAAYHAGQAIALTRTTGCHALSYYLTAEYGIPHGQAVGFFLPVFFIYNDEPSVQNKLQIIYKILGVNSAMTAFYLISDMMRRCGLATKFSELKLDVDLDKLIQSVNTERFANNPVSLDEQKLKELIIHYIA